MYKPKSTPITHSDTENLPQKQLPECFTVLAWNLQKTDFSHFMHRSIKELFTQLNIDIQPQILSLQEAKTWPTQNSFFNLPFIMAPNIQTKRHYFGVLTASSSIITPMRQC
ncbi:MAG: EEP domain-containing protein, partial [Thiomicrorhabdus sp.]|nr:EEP domain-containing protein [Thiomicrorhabdus sp.]